jgi:hypothetical protein
MTRDEYEVRKRRLEDELRSSMELLQAAFQTQLRALEMVWMGFSGEPVSTPPPAPLSVAVPDAVPAHPVRRRLGQIYADVEAALPQLPEVFDRNHVRQRLGYEPDRVALYRVLNELVAAGSLRVEVRGGGQTPSTYRRTEL